MNTSKSNNSTRRIGAGLVALALPLLMLSFAPPVANATTVGSTVAAVDKCAWFFSGSRDIIVGSTERYNGDSLTLTNVSESIAAQLRTDEDYVVALTGSKASAPFAGLGTSMDCSFYNNIFGYAVRVDADNTPFSASYQKPVGDGFETTVISTLGFNLVGSAMSFAVALRDGQGSTTCDTGFTAFGGNLVAGQNLALIERTTVGLLGNYGSGVGPFCNPQTIVSVTLPEVTLPPEGTGTTVTFTGPILTFSSQLLN